MSFKLLDKEYSRDRDLELRRKKKSYSKKEQKIMDTQRDTRFSILKFK